MREVVKGALVLLLVVLIAAIAETITVNAHGIAWEEANGMPVAETLTESVGVTDEEFDLLCRCVYAEAGNQGETGQRLVASVVLNRVSSERFANDITSVIKSPEQFVWAGNASEEVKNSVMKELQERTNYEVLYFRTGRYHDFGTPVLNHGAHYFSK